MQLPLLLDMLQATPQKIDLQRLPTYLPLQLGDLTLIGPPQAVTHECLRSVVLQFPPPAMQTFALTSQARATSANETPNPSLPTAASLNSLVNFLRPAPMTQFSIR